MFAGVSAGGAVAKITITNTWGNTSGARTGTVTASAQTVNKPTGSPGQLSLSYTVNSGSPGNCQYQQNAGTWTNLTISPTPTLVTFANGDTLNFRVLAGSSPYSVTVNLTDTQTNKTPKRNDSPLADATCTFTGT